jgi:hypothetical protein
VKLIKRYPAFLYFSSETMSRLRTICLALLAALCLTGCVQYDVGIHFANQTQGEIVQHIRLGDQLITFSSSVAKDWLQSIKQRSRALGGRVKQVSGQELIVTIPFHNGADLTEKFNKFFQPVPDQSSAATSQVGNESLTIPELRSQLQLTQSNWLLMERDRLVYDLDLRPLGVISTNGNLLISPGVLLNLEFRLDVPWGIRSTSSVKQTTSEKTASEKHPVMASRRQGRQMVWVLESGALNHLEAVFWVPSSLGIGTVAIVLLVLGGIYLRAQLFPQSEIESAKDRGLNNLRRLG